MLNLTWIVIFLLIPAFSMPIIVAVYLWRKYQVAEWYRLDSEHHRLNCKWDLGENFEDEITRIMRLDDLYPPELTNPRK